MKKAFPLALAMLMTAMGHLASAAEPGTRTFVYDCPLCKDKLLGFPRPNVDTMDRLRGIWSMTSDLTPGDKVVICNNKQCVTYIYTDNGDWLGVQVQQQASTGSGPVEHPPGPPPSGGSGIDRPWNHVCGTATGGGESHITCILTP